MKIEIQLAILSASLVAIYIMSILGVLNRLLSIFKRPWSRILSCLSKTSDVIKGSIIIAITVAIAAWSAIYFSSYQTCVRSLVNSGGQIDAVQVYCNRR